MQTHQGLIEIEIKFCVAKPDMKRHYDGQNVGVEIKAKQNTAGLKRKGPLSDDYIGSDQGTLEKNSVISSLLNQKRKTVVFHNVMTHI